MVKPAAPSLPSGAEKQLSRRILVIVNRDPMLKTPRVIWEHEKPILDELFGDGNVVDVDPATLDEGYSPKIRADLLIHNKVQDTIQRPSDSQGIGFVFVGSPAVEYQRLAEVYGKHPEENISMVEKIYGRAQTKAFERLMGRPELSDLPQAQLRALVLDYGYAPDVHKDATLDEKRAVAEKRRALTVMAPEALVKVAEEIGVEVG